MSEITHAPGQSRAGAASIARPTVAVKRDLISPPLKRIRSAGKMPQAAEVLARKSGDLILPPEPGFRRTIVIYESDCSPCRLRLRELCPNEGLSGEAGAVHRRACERWVLGAAHRDEPDRDHPIRFQKRRGNRALRQLHSRGEGAARCSVRESQVPAVSVR